MSWDIYGNPLTRGHCEVHPHVAEEYPCSVCLSVLQQREQATQQCMDCQESEHCLGQAHEHIKALESQCRAQIDALEEIAQWIDRWASADHPVATVARKALATYRKQGGES